MSALVLIIGIVESLAVAIFLFVMAKKGDSGARDALVAIETEIADKQGLLTRIEALSAEMIEVAQVKGKLRELIVAKESLKAERGRVTITQAELETIEVRLRELDEIARELEASSTETKEEVKILQRKEKELASKNDQLKQQIADSLNRMDAILSEIEMSSQLQEQVAKMKGELMRTEGQIQTLQSEIEQGNEQYFVLKKRYDALDIEYAQLYEKFAEQQG